MREFHAFSTFRGVLRIRSLHLLRHEWGRELSHDAGNALKRCYIPLRWYSTAFIKTGGAFY